MSNYQIDGFWPPRWHTDKNNHIDDCCEAHWKGADEKRLHWVPYHCKPYFRIYGITENGYHEKDTEEKDIQGEDDDGYPIEPAAIIGQIV